MQKYRFNSRNAELWNTVYFILLPFYHELIDQNGYKLYNLINYIEKII
jgi:hypothetical protein